MAKTSHLYVGVGRARAPLDSGAIGLFRAPLQGGDWEHLVDDVEIHVIVAHPTVRDLIFVGTSKGVIRSRDGGRNWQVVEGISDTAIWSVMVHPADHNVVLAGGSSLGTFRSTDGGESFSDVTPDQLKPRVKMPFECRVMRFAVHPDNPAAIHAALEVNGVMLSKDMGVHWEDANDDLIRLSAEPHLRNRVVSDSESEGILDAHALVTTDAAPGVVLLAVRIGMFRSDDRGSHWHDLSKVAPLRYARDLRVSPHDPSVIYACLSNTLWGEEASLYRSEDAGRNWHQLDLGLTTESTAMAIALDRDDAGRIFLAMRQGQIFETKDGGSHWSERRMPADSRDIYAAACL
jgi:photosystem II stability/assembly factor-like uncharacterized protein